MLIEFLPGSPRRCEGSLLFPFLKGLAQEKGVPTDWLCVGAPAAYPGSFQPTHIISSRPLPGKMRQRLDAARRRPASVVMPSLARARRTEDAPDYAKCGWFLDWLGRSDPKRSPRYLVEEASPDYARQAADGAARPLQPLTSIVSGVLCGNRRGARGKQPKGARDGCASCGCNRTTLTSPGADLLSLVEKQFRGIRRTAAASDRGKALYEFCDIRAFLKFDEAFEIVLRLELPAGIFLFDPRVEDVLRTQERIARTLPALEKAGHELRIPSLGQEDFAAREGARYDKEIPAAQAKAFLALTRAWSRAYPAVLRPD